MSAKPVYRIRGLSALSAPPSNPPKVAVPVPILSESEIAVPFAAACPSDDVHFGVVVAALGEVTLPEYLQLRNLRQLRRFWPTCDFFRSRRSPLPVKRMPLAIGEYLLGDEFEFRPLYRAWHRQKEESDTITELLRRSEAREDLVDLPDEIPPVAAAIASHLFRGSAGFRARRDQLLDHICARPESAYLGLLTGTWPQEIQRLAEVVQGDPRLAMEVLRHPALTEAASHIKLDDALLANPALFALSPYLNVMDAEEEAWSKLEAAAESHPMAAAVALGLQKCERKWIDIIKGSPEAMYWAVRIGAQTCFPDELPYFEEFRDSVIRNDQWGYHWIRDFESDKAFDFIELHWPDPWAIELAVDLQLSGASMVRHYQQAKEYVQFLTHALADSVTLWVHEFHINRDEHENQD